MSSNTSPGDPGDVSLEADSIEATATGAVPEPLAVGLSAPPCFIGVARGATNSLAGGSFARPFSPDRRLRPSPDLGQRLLLDPRHTARLDWLQRVAAVSPTVLFHRTNRHLLAMSLCLV
jgi:hypothetical protein